MEIEHTRLTSTATAGEEMRKNRAAFLLGFYLETGSVECIFEPLIQISPALSVSKVLLLEMCMARMRSNLCRARALTNEPEPIFTSEFDRSVRLAASPSFQINHLKLEFQLEMRSLSQIAAHLWAGQSSTRRWYEAGLRCG